MPLQPRRKRKRKSISEEDKASQRAPFSKACQMHLCTNQSSSWTFPSGQCAEVSELLAAFSFSPTLGA
ncbi:hypothetical protein PBY51_016630 [Eleginops maclovinus]|uniref:Uncharacterized protein n=1 Tax=Eleginops maclovinus TaxID=56733 RepID=A0AAN8A9X7_ELEMC|nr:hypothetical protein PBY51_016630 [Eleginops maclovinus]